MHPNRGMADTFTVTPGDDTSLLFRKIAWRLMPFLFVCYLVAQVDRLNVSFAKLQMLDQLGFSEMVYGMGAGILFVGYVLFEVPSNIMLKRFGARRWIARIMISWGIISAAMMFVKTPTQFYVMRFLLGAAEAGFFPGVIYYLADWFPKQHRTRMTAIFMAAIAVSGVLVGPASGAILRGMHHIGGLAGWQWLFIVEGLPAVGLGFITLLYLPTSPQKATWLSADEKRHLMELIASERVDLREEKLTRIVTSFRVWALAGIWGCYAVSFFGFVFWLPTIIKSAGVTDPFQIGLVSAIPWAVALVAMCVVATLVDRHQNTGKVLIVLSLLSSVSWALSPMVSSSVWLSMIVLSAALLGLMASLPVFWNLPTATYQGTTSAAVALAFISSIGNIPSFLSPYIVGWIRTTTHRMDAAMYMFTAVGLLAIVLIGLASKTQKTTA